MDIKQIKQTLKLSDAEIAEMFGYKTAMAYYNSSAKSRIEKGVEILYQKIKEKSEEK